MNNSDGNNSGNKITKRPSFAEIVKEEKIRKEERDKIRAEGNAERKYWKEKSTWQLIQIVIQADINGSKARKDKRLTEETRKLRLNFFEYQSQRAQTELYQQNPERVKCLLLSPNVVPIKSK